MNSTDNLKLEQKQEMDVEPARHKRRQAIDRIKEFRQSGPSVPTEMVVELLRDAREDRR